MQPASAHASPAMSGGPNTTAAGVGFFLVLFFLTVLVLLPGVLILALGDQLRSVFVDQPLEDDLSGSLHRLFPVDQQIFQELIARIDADGDGLISRDEYSRYSDRMDVFDQVDSDGDLRLGQAELEQAIFLLDPTNSQLRAM